MHCYLLFLSSRDVLFLSLLSDIQLKLVHGYCLIPWAIHAVTGVDRLVGWGVEGLYEPGQIGIIGAAGTFQSAAAISVIEGIGLINLVVIGIRVLSRLTVIVIANISWYVTTVTDVARTAIVII